MSDLPTQSPLPLHNRRRTPSIDHATRKRRRRSPSDSPSSRPSRRRRTISPSRSHSPPVNLPTRDSYRRNRSRSPVPPYTHRRSSRDRTTHRYRWSRSRTASSRSISRSRSRSPIRLRSRSPLRHTSRSQSPYRSRRSRYGSPHRYDRWHRSPSYDQRYNRLVSPPRYSYPRPDSYAYAREGRRERSSARDAYFRDEAYMRRDGRDARPRARSLNRSHSPDRRRRPERRNRRMERRERRRQIRERGPLSPSQMMDKELVDELFLSALKLVLKYRRPPFNISIISDYMSDINNNWAVWKSQYSSFSELCRMQERMGHLKMARKGESVVLQSSQYEPNEIVKRPDEEKSNRRRRRNEQEKIGNDGVDEESKSKEAEWNGVEKKVIEAADDVLLGNNKGNEADADGSTAVDASGGATSSGNKEDLEGLSDEDMIEKKSEEVTGDTRMQTELVQ